MRQSNLFTKTRREAPKDEVSKNAKLLVRAGFIYKELAGVYTYLPLGLRTINKIQSVIREEMNAIGGVEIDLTALQDPSVWKQSGRWDNAAVDAWFKTSLSDGTELGLGFTHEEPLTRLMKDHISSYRDLPSYPYQIQLKFRNELRAKSGLMRTREFLMKDLYSFSRDEAEHRDFYERCAEAYLRIFERVGIGASTYRTFASGGSFSKYSDEFQTLTDVGEDIIYVHEEKRIAVNKEVYTDEVLQDIGLPKEELVGKKAVEVGNIFSLGTRFSEALGLTYKNETGKSIPVVMGSYGIGLGRLLGMVVELLSDEKGLVWPDEIAPFSAHIVLVGDDGDVKEKAESLYKELSEDGVEVLLDDRDCSAGEKFADADLIGIPHRIVVSTKSLAEGGVEYAQRSEEEAKVVTQEEVRSRFS